MRAIWRYALGATLAWTMLVIVLYLVSAVLRIKEPLFEYVTSSWIQILQYFLFWIVGLCILALFVHRAKQRMSERDRSISVLFENEQRYRNLMERALSPTAVIHGGQYKYVNPACAKLLGFASAVEIVGMEVNATISPQYLTFTAECCSHRLRGDAVPEFYEIKLLRKDGVEVWVEVHAHLVDYLGETAIQAQFHDIDARKKAQEALRVSEEKYRSLVESLNDWVWEMDAQGRYTYSSPKIEQILGYKPSEIIGLLPYDLMPPQAIAQARPVLHRVFANRESLRYFESSALHRDGREIIFENSASPVFDDTGQFIGYRGVCHDITERKAAEAALKQSEEQFRSLVENMREGIILVDTQGVVQFTNNAAAEMAGQEPGQLMGRQIRQLIAAAEQQRLDAELLSWAAGRSTSYETAMQRADGSLLDIQLNATPRYDNDQKYIGPFILVLDITERKRVESESRLNEARLEAMVRLTQMYESTDQELCHFALEQGVALTGSSVGYLAFVSSDEQYLTMYAWNKAAMAECKTITMPVVYTVADTGLWGEAVRQRRPIITNEYSAQTPHAKGLPHGHVRITRHMNIPVFEGDKIVIVAGVGNKAGAYDNNDIRQLSFLMNGMWSLLQRRWAQEALRESEAKLRAFADQALVGFLILQDKRVIYANEAVAAISGYSVEELQQFSKDELMNIIDINDQALAANINQSINESKVLPTLRQFECRVIKKTGELRWLLMHSTQTQIGCAPAVVVLITDNTERKAAEAAMHQQQREESIATLAGGIAHDFNNILLGVLGSATLLAETLPGDHNGHELCQTIATSAHRMADLTAKLLAYAQGGRYQPGPLSLNAAVHDTLEMLRGSKPSPVKTELMLGSDLWPVEADASQVHQVLLNLIFNAYESMAGTGGTLSIATENIHRDSWICPTCGAHPAGDYVSIKVHDTGQGIETAQLPRVFEPYFSTKAPGRGLGLAAVQGIVRNHGGCITVDSTPGKETTFQILLPRGQRHPDLQRQEAHHSLDGQETVLVVDDEELVLTIAERVLQRHGYTVLTAADGASGLAIAQQQLSRIDVVVLDVQMPGMDGPQLLHRLRQLGYHGKAVFSSGYSDTLLEDQLSPEQADGFIHKPYSAQDLLGSVRAALDAPGSDSRSAIA